VAFDGRHEDKREGHKAPIKNEPATGQERQRHPRHGTYQRPDSATSQFFINVKDNTFLNGEKDKPGYAVFGKASRDGRCQEIEQDENRQQGPHQTSRSTP